MSVRAKRFKKTLALIALSICAILAGCQSKLPGHDLDMVKSKVQMGMSEFEVTTTAGTPNHVAIDGDTRTLRYDSKEGSGVVEVVLKQNRVIEVKTK